MVTLARGSVAVSSKSQLQPTMIKPGQEVAFSSQGVTAPVNVNVQDAMAWHGGRYVFYRARLGDVIRELERYRPGRVMIPYSAAGGAAGHRQFLSCKYRQGSGFVTGQVSASAMRKVTNYLVIITQ